MVKMIMVTREKGSGPAIWASWLGVKRDLSEKGYSIENGPAVFANLAIEELIPRFGSKNLKRVPARGSIPFRRLK